MKQTFAFKSTLGPTIVRYLELNFALGRISLLSQLDGGPTRRC